MPCYHPAEIAEENRKTSAREQACDDWTRGSVWRHLKSGRVYTVVGHCRLEASGEPAVLYCRPEDGTLWVRSTDEFLDGRFERIKV